MAIAIDGDGTITGINVGGLPDGIVDADMLGTKTFTSYAIICDEKAHDASAGTATSGAWRTRDLNTEIADPDGIVSISSNQFTLGAGSYLIEASAPAYTINRHQVRIYNATSSSVVQYGENAFCNNGSAVHNRSAVTARVTITGNTAFELQQRFETNGTTNGLGIENSFGATSIFSTVKIYKEA